MRQYKLKKYKLSAEATRSGSDIWLQGTFGPYGFEATTQECKECCSYIVNSTSVWPIKNQPGRRALHNALMTIEDRLANAQVPKFQNGESAQVNL